MKFTFLFILLSLALVACSGTLPTATPGPKVIQTEGLTPTPTPVPTATPYPTYTPYPTPTLIPLPDIDATIQAKVDGILDSMVTPTPELMATATIPTGGVTPTPWPPVTPIPPTATPEPHIHAVAPPDVNTAALALSIRAISIKNRTLTISGTMEGTKYKPTSIQVWQAYDYEQYSDTCSTERPVAFVLPGNGSVTYSGQTSDYTWSFCRKGVTSSTQTDKVPWLYSQSWEYKLRQRQFTYDPYIYDFSASVNLDNERVEKLEYGSGVASGWRIIVYHNDQIVANQWLDY